MRGSSWIKWGSMSAAMAGGFVVGGQIAAFEEGVLAGRWVIISGAIGVILLIPVSWLYWQSLDELAKEAHKSAWMWGGSIGMLIVTIPIAVLIEGVQSERIDLAGLDPEVASILGFSAGAGTAISGAVGGYVIAWAIYWIRKR